MRSTTLTVAVWLWFSASIWAQQPGPAPEADPAAADAVQVEEPQQVPTPYEAVRLAEEDLLTLSQDTWGFQRYFLVYDRSKEFYGAFNYLLNTCVSHSTTLYRPAIVADGWLIRVDLRRLWPRTNDYDALFPEFEKLAQIEPYFHTNGEIVIRETKRTLVPAPRYQASDGKFYTRKWKEEVVTRKQFGSEHSLHLLGPDKAEAPIFHLVTRCNTDIPIMRADWFMYIISTQDPRENGKYYTFRRVSGSQGGKTAEELWLASQGVDYETIQELRGDQRIGKWRSDVTGQPRAIEYFFTSATRPSVGPSAVFITRDWFLGKIDAGRHPIKNLLNYNHDGTEALGFLPNGMMSFVLFDDKGGLIDVAPQTLVTDRTVPIPHPANLQPPISCIRCHGPTDMWMGATNDIMAFTKGAQGLNFFDDESDTQEADDTLDRLAGLYAGEVAEPLRLIRNTHAKATFIVTGGMQIPAVAEKIGSVYNQYRFAPITPQQACLELGWQVPEADAVEMLTQILPPLPPNRFGISPESVTIGTLRVWKSDRPLHINRTDWEQEYADAMLRVITESIRIQAQ